MSCVSGSAPSRRPAARWPARAVRSLVGALFPATVAGRASAAIDVAEPQLTVGYRAPAATDDPASSYQWPVPVVQNGEVVRGTEAELDRAEEEEAEEWEEDLVDLSEDDAELEMQIACRHCLSASNEEEMILCDRETHAGKCNRAYHVNCAGLREVPVGEWFCPPCVALEAKASLSGGRGRRCSVKTASSSAIPPPPICRGDGAVASPVVTAAATEDRLDEMQVEISLDADQMDQALRILHEGGTILDVLKAESPCSIPAHVGRSVLAFQKAARPDGQGAEIHGEVDVDDSHFDLALGILRRCVKGGRCGAPCQGQFDIDALGSPMMQPLVDALEEVDALKEDFSSVPRLALGEATWPEEERPIDISTPGRSTHRSGDKYDLARSTPPKLLAVGRGGNSESSSPSQDGSTRRWRQGVLTPQQSDRSKRRRTGHK